MKDVRAVLDDLGYDNVKTYIQSGNVVFQSKKKTTRKLAQDIASAIETSYECTPHVLVLTQGELRDALAANPFPEGEDQPKTLHLFFLESLPDSPDVKKLESLKADSERFELAGSVFYLFAPEGIGRSRLAARAEKALGVAVTARNWRTASTLLALATEVTP